MLFSAIFTIFEDTIDSLEAKVAEAMGYTSY
jgi:hypothetical protein